LNPKRLNAESKFYNEISECPLEITASYIRRNSIGTPELSVSCKNNSDKTIDAFTVSFYCYDNFNNPVNKYGYGGNALPAIAQVKISSGGTHDGNYYWWTAYGYENTTKYKAYITEIHFTDNTTWEMSQASIINAKMYTDQIINNITFG